MDVPLSTIDASGLHAADLPVFSELDDEDLLRAISSVVNSLVQVVCVSQELEIHDMAFTPPEDLLRIVTEKTAQKLEQAGSANTTRQKYDDSYSMVLDRNMIVPIKLDLLTLYVCAELNKVKPADLKQHGVRKVLDSATSRAVKSYYPKDQSRAKFSERLPDVSDFETLIGKIESRLHDALNAEIRKTNGQAAGSAL